MSRRVRGDTGATAVEVALVLPVLLLLLGGVLAFGLHLTYSALAGHTAEVALRKATLRTSTGYPTAAQVDASVRAMPLTNLLGDPSAPVELTVVSTTGRQRQGDRVTVTVSYDVPALRAAAGAVFGLRGVFERLATIERTVDGRLE
jgi:Flp pilus assembly protein TadG